MKKNIKTAVKQWIIIFKNSSADNSPIIARHPKDALDTYFRFIGGADIGISPSEDETIVITERSDSSFSFGDEFAEWRVKES